MDAKQVHAFQKIIHGSTLDTIGSKKVSNPDAKHRNNDAVQLDAKAKTSFFQKKAGGTSTVTMLELKTQKI
jgi:hypothetical protein